MPTKKTAIAAFRDEMARRRRGQRQAKASDNGHRALAAKDAEIATLKALAASGKLSGATLAPVIEARGLAHDSLSGPVPVKTRRDGRTVLAIAIDPAPLFRTTRSIAHKVVAGAGFYQRAHPY